MPVLQLKDGVIEWGGRTLLDHAQLSVDAGERIGLIGRNGEGKSTLLAALAGEYRLDAGDLWFDGGLRLAHLAQEPELPAGETIREAILRGHPLWGQWGSDEPELWSLEARAEALCQSLDVEPNAPCRALSGGQHKRAAIAATLITEPDILILDEPTNHMDLAGIEALENSLLRFRGTLLFITHDRRFLERLSTRIVELDRGQLRSFPGSFSAYQRRKEEILAAEAADLDRLEGQLAEEEAWLRQGVKARAKRNQGRLRRLEQLREARRQRQSQLGEAKIVLQDADRSGQLVAELDGVDFAHGEQCIVRGFSTRIERGDRVGIVGPNGAGKTTLLRLILGELEPSAGRIRRGTRQEIAYFDQLRSQLDPESRVMDVIADGNDFLDFQGERRHVLGYLQDFLFPPDRARGLVKGLSGGERARLLLARLFARPANILVLDEPTNDLDLESVDLLEERLQNFPGTVLLVSHDREFLDQVVTQSIVHLGPGHWLNMAGGHGEWMRWQSAQKATPTPMSSAAAKSPEPPQRSNGQRKRKVTLSSWERQELGELPARIEGLEAEQEALALSQANPEVYRDAVRLQALQDSAQRLQAELAQAYARWESLESKASEASGAST